MSDKTAIEWTDATWNPITGCSVVSAGCKHCYAMRLAGRRLRNHPSRKGLTIETKSGPVWTGEVRFNPQWLEQPLAWTKPRRVFVCAHSDLFHPSVPDDWIDQVFAVMALAPQHTFQVLTKRPERALRYFQAIESEVAVTPENEGLRSALIEGNAQAIYARRNAGEDPSEWLAVHLPLANVQLGVSVEDQFAADERIEQLLQCDVSTHFLSIEPLLGPITLRREWLDGVRKGEAFRDGFGNEYHHAVSGHRLRWAIVGGESGDGARPMHPAWVRSLRDQCTAAGVAFFFKQWGEWRAPQASAIGNLVEEMHAPLAVVTPHGTTIYGPDLAEIVGRPPDCVVVAHLGKRTAGRILDGRTWDEMPPAPRVP